MRAQRLLRVGERARIRVVAASLGLALVLAPPAVAGRDGTLRVGTTSRPASLNPYAPSNRGAEAVLSLVYDTLVVSNPGGTPSPGIAAAWKPSRDRLTWLFTIRSGVAWSDGVLLTAEDVAYSLRRAAGSRGPLARYLRGVERVEAISPSVVVVRLRRPLARFPDIPVPIVPKDVWETVSDDELLRYANDPPVGSGPFRVVRADDRVIRLVANPGHWAGRPRLAAVEFRLFDDDRALARALETDRIDVADDLSPAAFSSLAGSDGVTTRTARSTTFVSVGVNSGSRGNGEAVLRETLVRQALSMAIDRDAIRREVLGVTGETGSTIVPPASPFHTTVSSPFLEHDPVKASELLREAGFRDRDGDGTLEARDRFPLELQLATRAALPETQAVGRLVADSLRAIGVTVEETTLTDAALSRRIRNGNVDLFVWGWTTELDPDLVLSALTCDERDGRGLNDTGFCDPRYDRLYQAQRSELDPAARLELIVRMQRFVVREAPYLVLYYRPWLQAYRPDRVPALAATPAEEPLLYGTSSRRLTLLTTISRGRPAAQTAPATPTGPIATTLESDRLWWAIAGGAVAASLLGFVVLANRSRRVLAREHEARERAARRHREEQRRRSAQRVVALHEQPEPEPEAGPPAAS